MLKGPLSIHVSMRKKKGCSKFRLLLAYGFQVTGLPKHGLVLSLSPLEKRWKARESHFGVIFRAPVAKLTGRAWDHCKRGKKQL